MADNVDITPGTGKTIAADDITSVLYQRVKLIHGADGVNDGDVSATNPLPTRPPKDTGRTHVTYYATAAAAGSTTTETAITLTKSSGTSATSTGVSHTPASGKRFRITGVVFAARGHSTATIQTTTFNLRVNTGGAVITSTTPIILAARVATPATASAWDRFIVPIPDGLEITGDGTLQFGVTAAATYTTNAPTWDVIITGFEYTP